LGVGATREKIHWVKNSMSVHELVVRTSIMYGGLGRIYGTYRGLGCSLRNYAQQTVGSEASQDNQVQTWTDQRPTTHASCVINCPPRTRLFQSLSIKQLSLDSEFKVLNALVIDHWRLWRLEMSPRFPSRRVCRFRWLSRKKQRERSHGGHVQ
jgi:hypothetical protein